MKKIKLFNLYGSTGQIGSKSLQIINKYFPSIKINLLVANKNCEKFIPASFLLKNGLGEKIILCDRKAAPYDLNSGESIISFN